MFLLDTDVLSASRRPEKAGQGLETWVANTNPRDMFLSAVSILEIKIGALRLSRRDQRRGAALDEWIRDRVLTKFEGRIIPFDALTALRCAPFHVPNTPPERDAMIAATALQHRFTIVTRNVRDFQRMGVPYLNPWTDA
ncbi:MAG: type II toxin-antitoxin system VapC family toxin [Rhizobiales bacterium]|nr:type II toxin-antitoxin system VapC family toxin [Hyphomicrobiales bacterium]